MARKTKAPRPARADRAAEQTDYGAWKIEAAADLATRHGVAPGSIPERLWRRLYIEGMTPQEAADKAADLIARKVRPAFERILGKMR
jgi:hypothetical protein